MRELQIGDYHTAEDWDLILNTMTINPPTPKLVSVPVDGRDGDIDLSDALTGEVMYNNREASFTFLVTNGTQAERQAQIDEIINAVHGLKTSIVIPDDPDHYLVGRCSVSDVHNDRAYGSFRITANCEPYRYSLIETTRTVTATETPTDFALYNAGRKTVTPTLVVTGAVLLVYGTTSVALENGTYKLPSLALKRGATTVKISGSGTVILTYREAVL